MPGKGRLLTAAETVGIDLRGVGKSGWREFILGPVSPYSLPPAALFVDEAQQIMSEEHSELGYRPPAGSLAAEAQAAATHHPQGEPGVEHPDPITLVEAAREDAQRVAYVFSTLVPVAMLLGLTTHCPRLLLVQNVNRTPFRASTCTPLRSRRPSYWSRMSTSCEYSSLDLLFAVVGSMCSRALRKSLGYTPPSGSLAAQAQAAVARRGAQPVTKGERRCH